MRKTYVLIAFFILISGCFAGCSRDANFKNQIVTVNLPEADSSLPGFSRWYIQIISKDSESDFFIDDESSFQIEVEINQPVSILAQPLFPLSEQFESDFFKPAGALFPYFCENGNIQLTWEGGFSAEILRQLFLSGKETGVTNEHLNDFISRFNWKKFQNTISQNISKSEDRFYNPWLLNKEKLLENLCMGVFQLSYLNLSYVYAVPTKKLELPADQIFFSSFVPENRFILENQVISLRKNEQELIYFSETLGANLTCNSAKKVSLEIVYMPIFLTGL